MRASLMTNGSEESPKRIASLSLSHNSSDSSKEGRSLSPNNIIDKELVNQHCQTEIGISGWDYKRRQNPQNFIVRNRNNVVSSYNKIRDDSPVRHRNYQTLNHEVAPIVRVSSRDRFSSRLSSSAPWIPVSKPVDYFSPITSNNNKNQYKAYQRIDYDQSHSKREPFGLFISNGDIEIQYRSLDKSTTNELWSVRGDVDKTSIEVLDRHKDWLKNVLGEKKAREEFGYNSKSS